MSDIVKIQLSFSEETKHGHYSDALYFTEEEWAKVDPKELDTIKQARVAKWVDYLDNPPVPAEPTKEELQAMLVEFEAQTVELERKKIETQEKIDTKLVDDGGVEDVPMDVKGQEK